MSSSITSVDGDVKAAVAAAALYEKYESFRSFAVDPKWDAMGDDRQ